MKPTSLPWALGAALLAVCGCAPSEAPGPTDALGAAGADIVGGTTDTGHPAVVAITIVTPQGQAMCSGTLISPTVIVTAAHCVPSVIPGDYQVIFGTYANSGTAYSVAQARAHPQWDPVNILNDIGVLVLSQAAPVSPMPIQRTALPNSLVSQQVTIVGFGITGATLQDEGTKRVATSLVYSLLPTQIVLRYNGVTNPCNGDSGGATFWTVGGVETLVGVHSYADTNCQVEGGDTRVDAFLAFLDPYLTNYCRADGICTPGCNPPDPDCKALGQPCSTAAQCESTQCSSGSGGTVCAQPCNAGACPSGFSCMADTSYHQTCFPASFACVADGVCVSSCNPPDPDCKPAGAACQSNLACASNLCLAPPTASGSICVTACNVATPTSCSASQSCTFDGIGHYYCADPPTNGSGSSASSGCLGCSSQGGASFPDLAFVVVALATLAIRRRLRAAP